MATYFYLSFGCWCSFSCFPFYWETEEVVRKIFCIKEYGQTASNRLVNVRRLQGGYYYSETQPSESGNFWRFVDGEPMIWE
jgi:hypothetical protein